jgi:hypothetical protein
MGKRSTLSDAPGPRKSVGRFAFAYLSDGRPSAVGFKRQRDAKPGLEGCEEVCEESDNRAEHE